MTTIAGSTIAALCYANKVEIDFSRLADELGDALSLGAAGRCQIQCEYDDFVVFDLGATRICLGHCDFTSDTASGTRTREQPDHPAECLIVSVGASPEGGGADPLYENRNDLCNSLAQEIDEVESSDRLVYLERDGVVTGDVLDEMIDLLRDLSLNETAAAEPVTAPNAAMGDPTENPTTEPAGPSNEAPTDAQAVDAVPDTAPSDQPGPQTAVMSDDATGPAPHPTRPVGRQRREGRPDRPSHAHRAAKRSVLESNGQRAGRQARPAGANRATLAAKGRAGYALTAPELWQMREQHELRDSVFSPTEEEAAETALAQSLTRRLAIYTINTGVILLSAPIGAAALTYCAMGRENARVAAYAMALTGIAMGLADAGIGGAVLNHVV